MTIGQRTTSDDETLLVQRKNRLECITDLLSIEKGIIVTAKTWTKAGNIALHTIEAIGGTRVDQLSDQDD